MRQKFERQPQNGMQYHCWRCGRLGDQHLLRHSASIGFFFRPPAAVVTKRTSSSCSTSSRTPAENVNHPFLIRRLYRILLRQWKEYKDDIVLLYPPISRQHEAKHLRDATNREAEPSDVMEYFRAHRTYQQHQQQQQTKPTPSPRVIVVGWDANEDSDDYDEDEGLARNNSNHKNRKLVFSVLNPQQQQQQQQQPPPPPPQQPPDASRHHMPMKPLLWCHRSILRDTIRSAFRGKNEDDVEAVGPSTSNSNSNSSSSSSYMIDDAIASYSILRHQQVMWQRTSSKLHGKATMMMMTTAAATTTTLPLIRITAVAQSVHHYNPNNNNNNNTTTTTHQHHRYGYRIKVENLHHHGSVQLMGRTWSIRPDIRQDDPSRTSTSRSMKDGDEEDESNSILHVRAENGGVVGEFPILKPGHVFEYQSAAEASSHGSMEGFFHFRPVTDDGKTMNEGKPFALPIGPFPLSSS